MPFAFGIDQLLADRQRINQLRQARVGLVAHPASVTSRLQHSMDALLAAGCNIVRAFGPQHGMRGDKQDNMVESDDYVDPATKIPVISLYGRHRYPTAEMLDGLDIILFDLQDIGCRIYTYITTLMYFIQSCTAQNTALWVLDRPNPAGRPVDGLMLEPGQESFVGCAPLPTRHGLTVGELAIWFARYHGLEPDLQVIAMKNYQPEKGPGFGWPLVPWINPSPNAAGLNMARCFPGTVLLEGTTLSEGRGTTRPLEIIGAPDFPVRDLLASLPPELHQGAALRECTFSPMFHKHEGELCFGLQIHTDFAGYEHEAFKPWRLIAGMLKLLRKIKPEYNLWRHHEYEYETDRIPIDVINGGTWLREWVDDDSRDFTDLTTQLAEAEQDWCREREGMLGYHFSDTPDS